MGDPHPHAAIITEYTDGNEFNSYIIFMLVTDEGSVNLK